MIGVDPGKHGAAVLLKENGEIEIYDFVDELSAANQIEEWRRKHDIALVVLEKVHSMPKQGVKSSFSFGMNYGVWRGILAASGLPWELVTPQAWQKGLIVKSDGADPKLRSLAVARRYFSKQGELFKRKKDADRADGALMALHAQRKIGGIKNQEKDILAL